MPGIKTDVLKALKTLKGSVPETQKFAYLHVINKIQNSKSEHIGFDGMELRCITNALDKHSLQFEKKSHKEFHHYKSLSVWFDQKREEFQQNFWKRRLAQ